MATIGQKGDPHLIATINGSGTGGGFAVGDDGVAPPAELFRVADTGIVTVLASIDRNQSTPLYVDNDNLSGTGTVVRLQDAATPDTRFVFSVETGAVRIAPDNTGDALELKGSVVRFVATGTGGTIVEFGDTSGAIGGKVTADGIEQYNGSDVTVDFEAEDANNDAVLTLGNPGAGIRGQALLHRDDTTNAEQAAVLVLQQENGTRRYLWVDTNGKLRIDSADPLTNDMAGTVIGPP